MTEPPEFELSKFDVMELFTGDRFYGDEGAAIREAILNALDACHRLETSTNSEYEPEISVIFDLSKDELIVEDNGDGMGPEEMKSLFTQIGKSARDLGSEGSETQVGEFGIGVVSYFLISNEFDVYSMNNEGESVKYRFSKRMFKDGEKAEPAPNDGREKRGTKVVLHIKDDIDLESLEGYYSKWIRSADAVTATEQPSGEIIKQGELPELENEISVDNPPDWVEEANIGVPAKIGSSTNLLGSARIQILYRGVYLDDKEFSGLWGIRGAIHADPSKIEPKLNREEIPEPSGEGEIEEFLQKIHPQALNLSLTSIWENIQKEGSPNDQKNLITRWLSVPRTADYEDTYERWDDKFRDVPIVEELTPDDRREYSINELSELDVEYIYYTSTYRNAGDLIREACNVLRNTEDFVFTGIDVNSSSLRNTNPVHNSTGRFLISEFSDELPEVRRVDNHKRDLIEVEREEELIYPGEPPVRAVSIGESSQPLIALSDEIWLNIDCDEGVEILNYLIIHEQRERGLVMASHLYSQDDIKMLSNQLINVGTEQEREIGPVKKRRIRKLIS